MAVTLEVADNGDGTGGVAAVAGSAPGSTNTLKRARFDGDVGVLPWETVGVRTGDGTIPITAGPMRAYYLWQVESDTGTVSVSPVYSRPLTDGTYNPVRTRVAEAIRDRLKLCDLDGIGEDKVYLVVDENEDQQAPCCLVLRDVLPDTYPGGTNLRDDVGYPVLVLLKDTGGKDPSAPIAKWDRWREKAERAFRMQRLTGVPEVQWCEVEVAKVPATETLPRVYQGVASAFLVRALSREPRGLEA